MNQVTKPPIKCIGVTLADLNAGMCKWILAEDCYCGNPAAKWRAPYCVHHAAVAYTGRRLERDRSEAGRARCLRDGGREGVELGRQISENSFVEISDSFRRNLGRPSGHETVF